MATYFTSDTHFNHANIIGYCKRPFRDVGHMNRELIQRWNERVTPDDMVLHLGDFALGKKEGMPAVFDSLNGEKMLVCGNHDSKTTRELGWVLTTPAMNWNLDYYCVHNPAQVPATLKSKFVFHGHLHGTTDLHPFPKLSGVTYVDVGVDCWDYRPVTLDEIMGRVR